MPDYLPAIVPDTGPVDDLPALGALAVVHGFAAAVDSAIASYEVTAAASGHAGSGSCSSGGGSSDGGGGDFSGGGGGGGGGGGSW